MNKILTPEDVRTKTFHTRHLREGYDVNEVDDFLDQITHTLDVQDHANRQLLKENLQLKNEMHA